MLHSYGDQDCLSTFTEPRSTPGDTVIIGERFLLKLYGAIRSTSLEKLCYILYTRSVSRSSLSSGFKLESLLPTAAAAKFHSYRANIAVQQWIWNNLCPTDRDGNLVPLTTDRPEDMRMPEGRVVPIYSHFNGQKTYVQKLILRK